MTKLDIYGGLLGAGKTTLIKAMLQCAYRDKRVAVIENEIGRVNLDAGAFSGVTVRPLTAGCVCCTLKGDLVAAIRELAHSVAPDYIVMEASGAADLDAICTEIDAVTLNRCVMVVNARKLQKLLTVVGEFYRIQLRDATAIYLNFAQGLPGAELDRIRQLLREINPSARVIDTPIDRLKDDSIPEGVECPGPMAPGFKPVPVHAFKGPPVDAAQGNRPALTVLDRAPLSDTLPANRFLRNFGATPTRKRGDSGTLASDNGRTLYTLTIRIPVPLTQQDLERLRQRLDQNCIWRAKGFATMSDGGVMKLDYAFGDFFTSPVSPDTASALDALVLIGEDRQALFTGDAAERFFGRRNQSGIK